MKPEERDALLLDLQCAGGHSDRGWLQLLCKRAATALTAQSPAGVPPEPTMLADAANNLYDAGHWHCDRPVDEAGLWTALRDALGRPAGTSPQPIRATGVPTTEPVAPDALPDNSQEWAKLDGGAAFHLIERHADDWDDARRMMEAWRCARSDALDALYAAVPAVPPDLQRALSAAENATIAGHHTMDWWDGWREALATVRQIAAVGVREQAPKEAKRDAGGDSSAPSNNR